VPVQISMKEESSDKEIDLNENHEK